MRVYFVMIYSICSVLVSGYARAADTTNKPATTVASVMSSEEFTSQVKSLGNQSKEKITSTLKSKLSQKPPLAPPPEPSTSSSTQSAPASNTPPQQGTSRPASPTPSPTGDSGYYSGFESQPSKPANSSSGGSSNSGSWNINY